jgi:signal transduction histidine kinase
MLLRQFLATFSHDVKTALASLRLQTDILREEVGDTPAINRLDSDVVRLQMVY